VAMYHATTVMTWALRALTLLLSCVQAVAFMDRFKEYLEEVGPWTVVAWYIATISAVAILFVTFYEPPEAEKKARRRGKKSGVGKDA